MRNNIVLLGLDWFSKVGALVNPKTRTVFFEAKHHKPQHGMHNQTNGGSMPTLVTELDLDEDLIEENREEIQGDSLLEEQKQQLNEVILKYNNLFADHYDQLCEGKTSPIKIKVEDDTPIFKYPYRQSPVEQEAVKEEVKKMMQAGIIRKSRSPWSFPIVMVPKKDGTRRFCVDYQALNERTVQDPYSLPRIDDLLDKLQGSCFFTGLDLKSGYWQLPLTDDSIPLTAFSTHDDHYEFVRLPFGTKNAPVEFSRKMQEILGGFSVVEIYLDDITIHSKTLQGHLEHLDMVLERLDAASLKLNRSKCYFAQSSISLLGHVIEKIKLE